MMNTLIDTAAAVAERAVSPLELVEEALAAGRKYVRIVHGHGTGRLKAAVREALRGHPGISRVEDAPQAQGGAGATVVTLR